ncbi:hypothetical protein CRUP_023645 [Coryphaenoides rupestris]|nr:hypothetical protein CRUP_023645 [Coryphaenoides rupestris]
MSQSDESTPLLKDDASSSEDLQDAADYKSRWRSIRVMYFTMFFSSIDGAADASFLGWVVAAYSLGQMVASPLFGLWSNHRPRREPLVCSLLINILANIYYAYVDLPPSGNRFHMLAARALVGFGAGNVAVVRSYVAGATSLKERTNAMANMSACQALGFILGPALQAGLSFIGERGVTVAALGLQLNMYTAPALLAAAFGVVNMLLGCWCSENILSMKKEGATLPSIAYRMEREGRIDQVAVLTSNLLFFLIMFIFAVFETIATPLSMDMFAWSRKEAVLYNGVIISCIGFESIAIFLVVKVVAQRIGDRPVLLGGLVVILCGFFILLPWGDHYPLIQWADIKNNSVVNQTFTDIFTTTATPGSPNSTVEPRGCPVAQTWCQYTPAIFLGQYITAAGLIGGGYAACNVIGARTVGPVFVSNFYTNMGPRWAFSVICSMVLAGVVLLASLYRRLVAYSLRHSRVR